MELTERGLSFFTTFEGLTGVMPNDYVESVGMVVFTVDQEKLGKAIGKNGVNINKLKLKFKKRILVVGDSADPEAFVRSYFNNINIMSLEVRDVMSEKALMITLDEKDRGIAIGRDGERIKSLKELLKKKFNMTAHIRTRRVIDIGGGVMESAPSG
ncbi:MAG: NusA-like transcription termination signal-binding factor [Candidatus Micrarchaeota archaeon]